VKPGGVPVPLGARGPGGYRRGAARVTVTLRGVGLPFREAARRALVMRIDAATREAVAKVLAGCQSPRRSMSDYVRARRALNHAHYAGTRDWFSACGRGLSPLWDSVTPDHAAVDCKSCRRTKAWRQAARPGPAAARPVARHARHNWGGPCA